jgi:hypothetical protein
MFVEVWKTDIQPQTGALLSNATTPLSTDSNNTSRSKTITPSRKRTAADAQLHQPSSTPPALRPVHIVSDIPPTEIDSDSLQLDEAIEIAFVGKGNDMIVTIGDSEI